MENAENTTIEIKVEKELEYSDWRCRLFGAGEDDGISWTPLKGKEPNWFWRKMQYIIFGNKWIKK